jgi:hypothetical protein
VALFPETTYGHWDQRRRDSLEYLAPSVWVAQSTWIGPTLGPHVVVGVRLMEWGRGRVDFSRHLCCYESRGRGDGGVDVEEWWFGNDSRSDEVENYGTVSQQMHELRDDESMYGTMSRVRRMEG